VGESNGFNYPCWTAFDKTGCEAAVKSAGGTVINLSEDKLVEVKFGGNTPLKRLFLPKTILEADAVVDLPLMKTHEFMAYSGAIKNLFGCVPSNKRIYLHPYLPEVVPTLYFSSRNYLMMHESASKATDPPKANQLRAGLMLTATTL
jgi:uncharacterized protein (DUF362 family)